MLGSVMRTIVASPELGVPLAMVSMMFFSSAQFRVSIALFALIPVLLKEVRFLEVARFS